MGVIAKRRAARQAKAVGDSRNNFGGALATVLGSNPSLRGRTTEQLLAATASNTWSRLATRLKAIRMAETHWTLLRPGRRTGFRDNREFRIHKSRLVEPVVRPDAVADRRKYVADLKARGFLTEQVEHPFLTMLRQGTMWSNNPQMQFSGADVATWMSTTVESVGEWFAALIREDLGAGPVPVKWLPIPPHWVTVPRLDAGQPNYEISRLGMIGSKGIPPADMAVYRQANAADPFDRGSGDMNATDGEVLQDELATSHLVSRLQNHGIPLLLMILAGLQGDEKKAIDHEWRRDLTGPLKAGMTKILDVPEGFDLKTDLFMQEMQSSVVDLDIATLRGHSRDASLMGNRVPPLAAGEQRSGNRAMALVAEKLLEMNAVNPAREGARSFYDSRFFQPIGSGRPPEYEGGFIVMWESREQTDEGSRDRMMAQVPGHFSRAQFLQVAGQQPRPGDENLYLIKNNEVLYDASTNQPVFTPPQPPGGLPFGGADIETPVTKFEGEIVALASLVDRLESGVVGQGE